MTYNQTAQHSTAQHSTAQHSTAVDNNRLFFACPQTLWTTGAFFPYSDP
ncbi:hypothetical protein MQC79_04005 [Lactococcus garvieae]|nr:hypothetical protein [Lactococcus garvieae]MCI3860246.1 hypothetical protein [Lactococcus garvieae]